MVNHAWKSHNVYTKNPLKICLTIYNDIFICSILASQGISLCFTEKMGNLKHTGLLYRSCQQDIVKVQATFKSFYQHECYQI